MLRHFFPILAFIFLSQFFSSCENKKATTDSDSTVIIAKAKGDTESLPVFSSPQNIEVKTFEIVDSLGKSHGWGYDLYVDGKKAIHQPIIPSIPGNNSFATESDAKKTGNFAAIKMKKTGSLPTITSGDLDSLGIKH